jgi:hypothetical protein
VNTSAARYQQLSLNPLKLAGQCGKLKCCLNYELDSYLDAIKDFPEINAKLQTEKGPAFHQKTDIFGRRMFYSYVSEPDNFIALSVERVKEIIKMNAEGKNPPELKDAKMIAYEKQAVIAEPDYENVVGQDSITRFDKSKKKKNRNKSRNKNRGGGGNKRFGRNKPNNRQQ